LSLYIFPKFFNQASFFNKTSTQVFQIGKQTEKMNIILKTPVKGNYKTVINAFDRKLFEALKPSVGKMEIVEFTGSKKGDKVHLRFISPIKADWISDIIEDGINENSAWFVDKGTTLPWPLKTWTHKHIVEKIDDDNSLIVDDISYSGGNFIVSFLMFPALFFAFYPRKKIYKSYFNK
jgi:ligand-binding SRPBCC domain-containing protein|tara:strand:+ start:81793 stop:82326 length:534 start_codon:yes stop_codon:yes gene_type:complete